MLAAWGTLGSAWPGVAAANVNYGGLQLCDQTRAGWGTGIGNNRQLNAVACGGSYYSFWLGNGVTASGGGTAATNAALWGNNTGQLHLYATGGVFFDGATTFGGPANLNGNRITRLANGIAGTDAVNLNQLNAAVAGAGGNNRVAVNGTAAAVASGGQAIAIGHGASTNGASALSLGGLARAAGSNATAVGAGSNATGEETTAVGQGAMATALRSTAYGRDARATGDGSVAIGSRSRASALNSVALGNTSEASRVNTVSFGNATLKRQLINVDDATEGTDAVNLRQMNAALGEKADNAYFKIGAYSGSGEMPPAAPAAASNYGVAIGVRAATTSWHGTAVGTAASAAYYGSSFGESATASGNFSAAYGAAAQATGTSSVAIGQRSLATHADSVALGSLSVTDRDNSVSVGNASVQRQITHLAAGTLAADSHDAVNGAQLFATNARIGRVENGEVGLVTFDAARAVVEVASARGGNEVALGGSAGPRRLSGLANGTRDDEAVTIAQLRAAGVLDPTSGSVLAALTYDRDDLAVATLGGTGGSVIENMRDGRVAAGSMQAVNGGQLFRALTDAASLLGGGAGVGLQGMFVAPTYVIQNSNYRNVGDALEALDHKVTEIDQRTAARGGRMGLASAAMSGPGPSTMAGPAVEARAADGTQRTQPGAAVLGDGALARGADSTAIGEAAFASAENSVALGFGSIADRADSVSIGSAGNERQLTHVAEGSEATDGVNKAQLDREIASARTYTDTRVQSVNDSFDIFKGEVDGRLHHMDRRIDRQGAMSAAMLNMATSTAGIHTANRVGVGVGFQGGESALSLGYQRAISERATVTLGGAMSGDDASVGFGAGFGW